MTWKRSPCGTFAKSGQAHSFAEYINITVCGAGRFTIAINIKVLVHLRNFPMKKTYKSFSSVVLFIVQMYKELKKNTYFEQQFGEYHNMNLFSWQIQV